MSIQLIKIHKMVQLAKVLSTKNTHLSELDLNMNLPSIQGEIALNDLAMSNETLYVEWKDPQSESSWSVEDIKEIINHYGPLEVRSPFPFLQPYIHHHHYYNNLSSYYLLLLLLLLLDLNM